MRTTEKVVFFFPWREVSGGPQYLSGLANELAKDERYDVWYVDYDPGLSDTMIDKTRVRKIVFTEPFWLPVQEPITLIVPVYCAAFIPKLHPKSKIVFLNWHNYCIQALLDIWHLSEEGLQCFLKMIFDHDAIFFLDQTHLWAQNQWIKPAGAYQFAQRYVPPKVLPSEVRCKENLISETEINIAVLGRLCTDKIFSILNLLTQLERVDDGRVKNVYVIGSGKEAARITNRVWGNNIAIHMMGTITGDELSVFLAEKSDVLFSMGMSVLEGARIGLPSVIMPHNIHPFETDAYAYLNDSKGYAVGWYDTQIDDMGIRMHTLEEILEEIYRNNRKASIGRSARTYLAENHLSNVESLKERIAATTLQFAKFNKFARKQGYIKVFGLPVAKLRTSFDCTEKRISFMGIESFLQCKITPEKKEVYLFGKLQNWILPQKDEVDGKYRIFIRVPFIKA